MGYPKKLYRNGDLTYEVVVANEEQERALPEEYVEMVSRQSQSVAWTQVANGPDPQEKLQRRQAEVEAAHAELTAQREQMDAERRELEKLREQLESFKGSAKDKEHHKDHK